MSDTSPDLLGSLSFLEDIPEEEGFDVSLMEADGSIRITVQGTDSQPDFNSLKDLVRSATVSFEQYLASSTPQISQPGAHSMLATETFAGQPSDTYDGMVLDDATTIHDMLPEPMAGGHAAEQHAVNPDYLCNMPDEAADVDSARPTPGCGAYPAVEADASAVADAQAEQGSNGTPAAMCNVQGESIVWDPQQQASSWGSDAPGSSSDTGYHTRPSTGTSMYSTSAPVSSSEPVGIPQNAGAQQMILAEDAMNQEISSLMVCLGQMSASYPQNWPRIIASHGHSLAANEMGDDAGRMCPEVLAEVLQGLLIFRDALVSVLLNNAIAPSQEEYPMQYDKETRLRRLQFKQAMSNMLQECVPLRAMLCNRFATVLREQALDMYFKIYVWHPYITHNKDRQRALASYTHRTQQQVLQKFTNYRARHMADDHKKILGIVCKRKFRATVWAVVAVVKWQNVRALRTAPLWVPAHLQLPSEMDIDTQLNAAHDTATWLDMAFENEAGWGGKLS
ncbi:TPA: hypothetical protein ACH3X3_002817 [Trebouxia sp. C0006]